jgi:hypothetical protein
MDMLRRQPLILLVLGFILGFAIGLFVFGWGLTPVEYTGAGPQDMQGPFQEAYLRNLADYYAYSGDQARVTSSLSIWPEAPTKICEMAAASQNTDPADAARLTALAAVINGTGCGAAPVLPGGETGTEADGGSNIFLICGLGLLLALILGAMLVIMGQRVSANRGGVGGAQYQDMPTGGPVMSLESGEQQATPVARFQSTYQRGHDTYDDSFSIENANGDFLGECGVGVSETIGAEMPKNVTAFEVWLFDKNDIRTVTKVIMSEHAYYDDAIKAKLAPKGEPELARPNETIVLETASLIINAEITELEYGTGTLPPQSYFERFTVVLSAWAKEGDYGEPDVQGRIDEMLNF